MANGVSKGDLNSSTSKITNALSSQGSALNNVNASLNSVSSQLDSVKNSIDNAANDPATEQALNGISTGLGDGFQLVEDSISNLSQDISSLEGVIAEKLTEIINLNNRIVTVDTETHQLQIASNAQAEENAGPEVPEEIFTPGTPNASVDIGTLTSTTSLENLNLQGFAVIATTLNALKTDILGNLEGLQSHVVAGNTQASLQHAQDTAERAKDQAAKKEDSGGIASNKLKTYLEQLTGPLNSVASGLMQLSLAMLVLGLAPLDAGTIGGIVAITIGMITVFSVITRLSQRYKANEEHLDPENENGILAKLQVFSKALLHVTLSFAIILATIALVAPTFLQGVAAIVSVGIIVASTFFLVRGLNTLVSQVDMETQVGENSPIMVLMNGFSKMVMMITLTSIVCGLFAPLILEGLTYATSIVLITFVVIRGLSLVSNRLTGSGAEEDMKSFLDLVDKFNKTVLTTAALTIVFGFLPMDMILQGGFVVGAIMAANVFMLYMLKKVLSEGESLDEKQVAAITGLLHSLTVMIAITSGLVILMGLLGLDIILPGLISMALIMSAPIILIKALDQVQAADMAKSMATIAMLSIFILAVAGLTLIITLATPDPVKTLLCAVAIVLMAGAFLMMAFAATQLASAANVLMTTTPFGPVFAAAVMGVALMIPIAIIIAGTAIMITYMFQTVEAEEVITTSKAMLMISAALAAMALSTLLLTAVAIPLALGVGFAILALGALGTFINAIETFLQKPELQKIGDNSESLSSTMESISSMVVAFAEASIGLVAALPSMILVGPAAFVARIALRSMSGLAYELLPMYLVLGNFKDSVGPGATTLTNAIDSFGNVLDKIDNLTIPEPGKLSAAKKMATGIKSLYKKILDIPLANESGNGTAQIDMLANSLEKLAGTNTGLREVADSLREIAAATKEVNELGELNIKSAEAMTGNSEIATEGQSVGPIGKEEPSVDLDSLKQDVAEIKGSMSSLVNSIGTLVAELHNLTTHVETTGGSRSSPFSLT